MARNPSQKKEVIEFSHYMLEILFQRIDTNKLFESFEDLEVKKVTGRCFEWRYLNDVDTEMEKFIGILYFDDNLKYFKSLKKNIKSREHYESYIDFLIEDFSYTVLALKSGEELNLSYENIYVENIIYQISK